MLLKPVPLSPRSSTSVGFWRFLFSRHSADALLPVSTGNSKSKGPDTSWAPRARVQTVLENQSEEWSSVTLSVEPEWGGQFCPPMGRVVTPGDILVATAGRGGYWQLVEARDVAKHPMMHRVAPRQRHPRLPMSTAEKILLERPFYRSEILKDCYILSENNKPRQR